MCLYNMYRYTYRYKEMYVLHTCECNLTWCYFLQDQHELRQQLASAQKQNDEQKRTIALLQQQMVSAAQCCLTAQGLGPVSRSTRSLRIT